MKKYGEIKECNPIEKKLELRRIYLQTKRKRQVLKK